MQTPGEIELIEPDPVVTEEADLEQHDHKSPYSEELSSLTLGRSTATKTAYSSKKNLEMINEPIVAIDSSYTTDMDTPLPMSVGSGLIAAIDVWSNDKTLGGLFGTAASAAMKTMSGTVGNPDSKEIKEIKTRVIIGEQREGVKSSVQIAIDTIKAVYQINLQGPLNELDQTFVNSPHKRRWNKLLTALSGSLQTTLSAPSMLLAPLTEVDTRLFYTAYYLWQAQRLDPLLDTPLADRINFIFEKICRKNKSAAKFLSICLLLVYFATTWSAKQMIEADLNTARNFGKMLGSFIEIFSAGRDNAFRAKKGIEILFSFGALLMPLMIGTNYLDPKITKTGNGLKNFLFDLPSSLNPLQWGVGDALTWFQSSKEWSYLSSLIQNPVKYANNRVGTYYYNGVMAWLTQVMGFALEQAQKKGIEPKFNAWKNNIEAATSNLREIVIEGIKSQDELYTDLNGVESAFKKLKKCKNKLGHEVVMAEFEKIKASLVALKENMQISKADRDFFARIYNLFNKDLSPLIPEKQIEAIEKLAHKISELVASYRHASTLLEENINNFYDLLSNWSGQQLQEKPRTPLEDLEMFKSTIMPLVNKCKDFELGVSVAELGQVEDLLNKTCTTNEEATKIIGEAQTQAKAIQKLRKAEKSKAILAQEMNIQAPLDGKGSPISPPTPEVMQELPVEASSTLADFSRGQIIIGAGEVYDNEVKTVTNQSNKHEEEPEPLVEISHRLIQKPLGNEHEKKPKNQESANIGVDVFQKRRAMYGGAFSTHGVGFHAKSKIPTVPSKETHLNLESPVLSPSTNNSEGT